MNRFHFFSLSAASLVFAACGTSSQPFSSSSYDPLRSPGSQFSSTEVDLGPTFSPGSFVETAGPDTAFFKDIPKGDARASRLLRSGEQVKVISMQSSYVKAELADGSIGYIPALMLEEKRSSNAVIVAGTGADPQLGYTDLPPLPEPIADPGNPDDFTSPLPDLSDTSVVPPIPDIPELSEGPQSLDEAADAVPSPAEARDVTEDLPAASAEPDVVNDPPPLPEPQ